MANFMSTESGNQHQRCDPLLMSINMVSSHSRDAYYLTIRGLCLGVLQEAAAQAKDYGVTTEKAVFLPSRSALSWSECIKSIRKTLTNMAITNKTILIIRDKKNLACIPQQPYRLLP